MKTAYPFSLVVAGACLTGAAGCTGSNAAPTESTTPTAAAPRGAEPRQVAEAVPQSRVSASGHGAARPSSVPSAVNAAASRPAPSMRGNPSRVTSAGTAAIRPTARIEGTVESSRVETPTAAGRVSPRVPSAPVSRRTDPATSQPSRLEPAPPAHLSTPPEDAVLEDGDSEVAGSDSDGAGAAEV